MATYTGTPSTVAAGETILASLWNSDVRDPVAALSGASNSYTPTVSQFTAGNGTVTGAYIQVGHLVLFRALLTFGSTSAAASSYCAFTLPVTAASTTSSYALWAYLSESGAGTYSATARLVTTSAVGVFRNGGTDGLLQNFSTTSPFTWGTGDGVRVSGVYEAA